MSGRFSTSRLAALSNAQSCNSSFSSNHSSFKHTSNLKKNLSNKYHQGISGCNLIFGNTFRVRYI